MNAISRFAGVARAARSFVGVEAGDTVLDRALADPNPKADDTAPLETPTDPKPEDEAAPDPKPDGEPEEAEQEGDPAEDPAPKPDPVADKPDAAASERARVADVFASEHSVGRERQAADMLATSMSATEITGLLAKSPKGGAAADSMLNRLASDPNPELGAGNADEADKSKSAEKVWGNLWAKPANKR